MNSETRSTSSLVWREDLYPRFQTIPRKVQEYAESVCLLPPIEVNQHNEIIDGYHRWTAHRKEGQEQIEVIVTQTQSDADLLALAYERNAHGIVAISGEEKKHGAIRMYADGTGKTEEEIAALLHVKKETVTGYLARTKKEGKTRRNQRVWDAWLSCQTEEEIATHENLTQQAIEHIVGNHKKSDAISKLVILSQYQEPDWTPPLYNVWKQQDKTNDVGHFGNSEASFTDRLLYLYTEPFDIIVDPFAGGGATIDVCKRRLRRYWVSDRLPIIERRDIRQHDILDGTPSLHKRWPDVALLFLDPPYWKQAEGQYSQDANDLANMPLNVFYDRLTEFTLACVAKMHTGATVAMLMQPTQWKADDRQAIDHVVDLLARLTGDRLRLDMRISCPYESQQCNAQQVKWAKGARRVLVITREILIWKVR